MQGVSIFPIAKFKGNRFNILFHNAAGVYYIKEHLTRYLSEVHATQNKLLQAVCKDLGNIHYVIGCHALGIINKCITGPLWRLIESAKTLKEIGSVYKTLRRHCQQWSDDSSSLLGGNGLEEIDHEDEVCKRLFSADTEGDDMTVELLQMLCKSYCLVIDRLLGDHLENGTFDTQEFEALEVPSTNVCSERDFALLDR